MDLTGEVNYLHDLGSQNKVKELEKQIDQKVNELYGLTHNEIVTMGGGRNV